MCRAEIEFHRNETTRLWFLATNIHPWSGPTHGPRPALRRYKPSGYGGARRACDHDRFRMQVRRETGAKGRARSPLPSDVVASEQRSSRSRPTGDSFWRILANATGVSGRPATTRSNAVRDTGDRGRPSDPQPNSWERPRTSAALLPDAIHRLGDHSSCATSLRYHLSIGRGLSGCFRHRSIVSSTRCR